MALDDLKIRLIADWLQILSALIPIIGLPWAIVKLIAYFKPHLIVAYQANWLSRDSDSLEWNIQIVNRTRKNRNINIVFVPHDPTSLVRVAWIDKTKHNLFDIDISIQNGKAVLSVLFWPKDRNLFININLDKSAFPTAFCDEYDVQVQFQDDNDDGESLIYHRLLWTARFRVIWFLGIFLILSLILLIRIAWLGFS